MSMSFDFLSKVDCWVTMVEKYLEHGTLEDLMKLAEEKLKASQYLCLNRRTLADLMLWTVIATDARVLIFYIVSEIP